ncbi:MAG TPA: HAMP domain-containing sensor histidine kinase [Candidatus Binatia bacterium]|jgi:signal transduction histidine kinase
MAAAAAPAFGQIRPGLGIFASRGRRWSICLDIVLTGALAGIALFGVYGFGMVLREKTDLRTAVTREMRILGESLRVAVQNAVRDQQLDDVREILDKLDLEDATVDITVSDVTGKLLAESPGAEFAEPEKSVATAVLSGVSSTLRYPREEDPGPAILGLPLRDDTGRMIGVLTLLRPLDDVRRDLSSTREGVIETVVLFVFAIAGIGWFTGTLFVRRPLQDVRSTVAAVRAGNFEQHIRVRREDEIGALAGEFNQMIDALADARRRRDEEIVVRGRLERGLAEVAKLAATGQLASSLAHEIGSPLQVMAGRARSLADHPDDAVGTRRNALILVEQCARVARIVGQLLNVGRRSTPKFAVFDVVAAVRPVAELLALEAERSRISVDFRAGAAPIEIEGNIDHVQQIVLNLVSNALAATAGAGRIEVTLDAIGEGARLRVADHGRGIPTEDLARVFEPFFTTRAEQGGTGLGLAIVKTIVKEHGGTIDLDSSPGHGTTVTVVLPFRKQAPGLAEVNW